MKLKVIGKIEPELVAKAEKLLSQVFLELALRYGNEHVGTNLGGDPFLFSLLQPMQHIATMGLPTAGTDGKRYYWNPKFVVRQSRIGLRLVCAHEAWHAIYMHPSRRGQRHPKLWNIAVDYIVNGTVMDDLRARKKDPASFFKEHLGNYVTLSQYAEHLKNPFIPVPGTDAFTPDAKKAAEESNVDDAVEPKPQVERELTEEEQEELEKFRKKHTYYYADSELPADMKKPEKIYDYLLSLLPKCPKCGRIGVYKRPKPGADPGSAGDSEEQSKESSGSDDKEDQEPKEKEESHDDHDHEPGEEPCEHEDDCDCEEKPGDQESGDDGCCDSDGSGKGSCSSGCGDCDGGYDIFNSGGGTLDDHMDANESPEKMAKRLADAIESAKKMAGYVPAGLEEELGLLMAPRVRWQDFIRAKISKSRAGNSKNDWTRFKSRQLFAGLMTPKKKNNFATFGCLLDTSGSMSKDDMAFGISQLQSIDERSEGNIVCGDADIYWDKMLKLRKMSKSDLLQLKITGRGGTMFAQFFDDYEAHFGKCDFLIVITDGYLLDTDIADMKNPGVDVIWLITSSCSFTAPFGRVFELKSM